MRRVASPQVQRVRWRLAGEKLERLYWNVLDQAVDSQPRVQKVLDGVQSLELRFLDDKGQWQEQWPPASGDRSPAEAEKRMPLAVEVKLEHRHYGKLSRLYRLPEPAMEETSDNGAHPGGNESGDKDGSDKATADKAGDGQNASGDTRATQ